MNKLYSLKYCLILFFIFFHLADLRAQALPRRKTTRVWITTNSHTVHYKGVLFKVTDSSIEISPKKLFDPMHIVSIKISEIEKIAYRRNYSIPGRIFSSGAVSGAPTALLIGGFAFVFGRLISSGNSGLSAGLYGARAGAIIGTPPGMLFGAVAFNMRKHIVINGSRAKFDLIKTKLRQRAIIQ